MRPFRAILITNLIVLLLSGVSIWQAAAAPPEQQADLAFISFPGDNEVVRGVISITGSAAHPAFDRFQVSYAREPVAGNNAWVAVGIERQDPVINGELAIWDTTTVPDGSYSLRLRVIRRDGNYSEIETNQVVVANAVPTETPTLEGPQETPTPTITPTSIPPTLTVIVEQPVVDTATPRALVLAGELPTPRPTSEGSLPIPDVIIDTAPIKSGCLWGGGAILLVFLFFGFLSAIRVFVMGFVDRTSHRRR
jgi:hypothetical protein